MERYTDTISGEELYVERLFGYKIYFKDKAMKIRHRHDGPAVEYQRGSKEWYVNGKSHRLDGPAKVWSNETADWYIDGVFIMELDKHSKFLSRMGEERI